MNATDALLNAPFVLRSRSAPLPCRYRPLWRIAILTLLIEQCRGEIATVQQLHALNWAIRTNDTRRQFLDFINGRRLPSQVRIRRDPSLNRALEFAYAEHIIAVPPHNPDTDAGLGDLRISLEPRGKVLTELIRSSSDLFAVEREFLDAIGKKVTQADIAKLFSGGI